MAEADTKNKHLAYENLWKYWLESNAEKTPEGFQPVIEKNGKESTFLTPENMMALLKAFSAFDLYQKPDYSPTEIDYPTTAFNIDNRRYGKIGIPEAIIMASQKPKNRLLPIYDMTEGAEKNYSDIPKRLQQFIPQGVYEHEVEHSEDLRLNPEAKNYGYLIRNGLQDKVAAREYPAMKAEDKLWDKLLSNKNFVKYLLSQANSARRTNASSPTR